MLVTHQAIDTYFMYRIFANDLQFSNNTSYFEVRGICRFDMKKYFAQMIGLEKCPF